MLSSEVIASSLGMASLMGVSEAEAEEKVILFAGQCCRQWVDFNWVLACSGFFTRNW